VPYPCRRFFLICPSYFFVTACPDEHTYSVHLVFAPVSAVFSTVTPLVLTPTLLDAHGLIALVHISGGESLFALAVFFVFFEVAVVRVYVVRPDQHASPVLHAIQEFAALLGAVFVKHFAFAMLQSVQPQSNEYMSRCIFEYTFAVLFSVQ